MAKELLGELAANLEYLTLQKPLNSTEAYNEMVTARQASQTHCSILEILFFLCLLCPCQVTNICEFNVTSRMACPLGCRFGQRGG